MDLDEFRKASDTVNEIIAANPAMLGDPVAFEALADQIERDVTTDPLRRLVVSELRARAEFMRANPAAG